MSAEAVEITSLDAGLLGGQLHMTGKRAERQQT